MYYQTYCWPVRLHFTYLTGMPILHIVITVASEWVGPTNLPLHMHGQLRTSFSLLHKSNIKHKHVYIIFIFRPIA